MRCPIDDTELVMSDRAGVEIDYCPKCRGVWLDRGELDKIIERSATSAPSQNSNRPVRRERRDDEYRSDRKYGYGDDRSYKKKRRKSILEEIFDFD